MAENASIGLVFAHNENWIGGTYYILNLIHALNTLPAEQKPHLVVFVGKPADARIVQETGYPYLSFQALNVEYSILTRVINKVSRKLLQKNIIQKKYNGATTQTIFPYDLQGILEDIPQKICWIPDFQEHYLHDFFSPEVLEVRRRHQLTLIEHNYPIIFSSKDAQQNFYEIYPDAQNPTYVVNFATTHLPYQHLDIEALRATYGVGKRYIISPNQFWKHKNHQIILDAMLALRQSQKLDFQIVFTGKEYDFRYPDYAENLKKFVQTHQLQDHIKFLGFIDRQDQLQLMNNALAVVQPSLFEGWSTVVEDAKAMNQYVIASSILVHQEQLDTYPNKTFFQPTDTESLVSVLKNLPTELPKHAYPYAKNVQNFALDFLKIVQKG